MRPAIARPLLGASLGLLACTDDARAPFDIDDITDDCTEVEVVHEALEIGTTIHSYVADAPGSSGGWALATVPDELDLPRVVVVRVPASADEPEIEPVGLGLSTLGSVRVELRAGAVPGELWVMQESGSATILRKLVPGAGAVAGNGAIANFPPNGGGGCPNDYTRELLLIEGRPFVLALPDCSDSPALDLQLLELDPQTLLFTSSWVLSFDPCGDDPTCGMVAYTLGSIRGGDSSPIADAERVAVGFSQVRDFFGGLTSTDVSLLELHMDSGDPKARVVTFRQVWLTPTNLDAVDLALDPYSVQLHVRNGGSELDAALLRFDAGGELYIQITTPQLLPFGGRGRLVQLASKSAMVDVRDGALELISLVDVASWPIWSAQIVYELDDLVAAEPAGIGHLLLRRAEAPTQIVRVRCLD